jgi:hypothetical protein
VITLAQNLGMPLAQSTVCIPLSNSVPVSNTAPCTPAVGTASLLDGEVNPPNDQFALTLAAPSPAGTVVPVPGNALDTTLAGGNVVSFTTPAAGFQTLNGSFVTCDVNGHDIISGTQPCAGVTTQYALQSASTPGTPNCSTNPFPAGFICNTFTVDVNATASFSQTSNQAPPTGLTGTPIFAILKNAVRCASCHAPSTYPATLPTGPACSTDSAQALCKWWAFTDTRAAFVPANASNTLATLSNTGAQDASAQPDCVSGATPCLVKGQPSASQLYLNVCSQTVVNGHGPVFVGTTGSPTSQQLTQTECNTLSQWIAEGANLN